MKDIVIEIFNLDSIELSENELSFVTKHHSWMMQILFSDLVKTDPWKMCNLQICLKDSRNYHKKLILSKLRKAIVMYATVGVRFWS